MGIYNTFYGPYKIINFKISLLCLVKHLTFPTPGQGSAGPSRPSVGVPASPPCLFLQYVTLFLPLGLFEPLSAFALSLSVFFFFF